VRLEGSERDTRAPEPPGPERRTSPGAGPPGPEGRPGRAVSRGLARGLAAAALVGGIVLAVAFHREGRLELDPEALRAWIEAQGWRAPLVFVAATAARIFLLLPSWVLMSAGGLLFGVVGGTLLGTVGFTLGALVAFGIPRALGRDAMAGRLSGGLARLDDTVRRRGAAWLGLYTALPITPLTPAHAAAGLSGMPPTAFAAAVAAGLAPRTLLFSWFGDSLAEGDWGQTLAALVLGAVLAALGVRLARRAPGRRRGDRAD